jgi:uncharacterized protein YjbJ (UPF0337 family)
MNKDQVKGTIDDVAGRAKRQVGEWTGDTNAQVEGLGQQVKGKAEKAWGTAKEAAQEGHQHLKEQAEKAWDKTKDAAQDGREQVQGKAKNAWNETKDAAHNAKEEAEQRRQQHAERVRDEDDLEPVAGAGKGTGKIVTPTR